MTLTKATLNYLVCLFIYSFTFVIIRKFSDDGNTIFLTIIGVYLACGIYLSRAVYSKLVEYHPIYATINNIFIDKITNIIFWVLKLPILIIKLTVLKIL